MDRLIVKVVKNTVGAQQDVLLVLTERHSVYLRGVNDTLRVTTVLLHFCHAIAKRTGDRQSARDHSVRSLDFYTLRISNTNILVLINTTAAQLNPFLLVSVARFVVSRDLANF